MIQTEQQHRHQIAYFDKEFSAINSYELTSWQQSYLDRISTYMLGGHSEGRALLDIATGSGYVAVEMAKRGLNVTACDLSSQAVDNLNRYREQFKLSNLRVINCVAESISLPDNSFDYIVANAILEHIEDEKKAVREWTRLLKPGGYILITVPLLYRYVWPFLWPVNYLHDKRIGHLRRYDRERLQKIFDLPIQRTFYTGHLIKVIGAACNALFSTPGLAGFCEKIDNTKSNLAYGASNIVMIMGKPSQADIL